MTSFPLCLPLRSPTGRRFPPQVVCSPKCRLIFDETQRRAAGMHRSPGAQRRRQRADRAEEGGRAGYPEGRVRRARPRAGSRALPAGHRVDRGLLPQGRRGAGRGRGWRPSLPGLPLRAPRQAAHQQRAGTRQPRAQAPQPRGAVLPHQEVAHQDDGRRVLGDGRGLGGPPMVQRRVHGKGTWRARR